MDKIYVGSGKESKFGVKINVCLDELFAYAKDNIDPAKNGKKYIRLEVTRRKNEDDHGNTHSVSVDTWKPDKKEENKQEKSSDIPF